ncbi:MAG TPA: hypothetical protein VHE12_06700 [bacterium]|nr:hypothetical protein [bacterium]
MKKVELAVLLFLLLSGKPLLAQDQAAQPAVPVPAGIPAVPQVPTESDFYSQALQAYLAGNYDQAILLDSRALQADPKDAKAQALLSILVNEKDKANQSVIWIGKENSGEVALAPAPVTVIQEKIVQRPAAPRPAAKTQGLAELEARVNAVAFLLERDQNSQYRELTGAQVAVQKRLDEINLNLHDLHQGATIGNILFLVALLVALAALWKSWRNGEDMRRQLGHLEYGKDRDESGRVVQMRKM